MTTYDLTIIGGTACGIIMVLGGILLLYKGAIKLEIASQDPSLTVEMFEKKFKLTTHVPALGLFVIGLLFVISAIYFAQTTTAKAIPIIGKTENVEEKINVLIKSEWPVPAHQGYVQAVIRPQLDVIWVVISAPGYNERTLVFTKEEFIKGVDLGTVQLEKTMERPEPNKNMIEELPADFRDISLDAGKTFGIGRRP